MGVAWLIFTLLPTMSTVLVLMGVCATVAGLTLVLNILVDPEAPTLAGVVLRALNRLPSLLWRLFGVLRLQWLLTCVSRSANWFTTAPHPLVQILYAVILVGGYGAFAVKGFPLLRAPNRNPYLAPWHIEVSYVVAGLCVLFFALASFSDPGVVRRDNLARYAALYPHDGVLYTAAKGDCSTCKQARPARSKHCRTCDRCVAKFDHHCIWLNNCVGEGNYRWFLGFLVAQSALLAYGTVGALAVLWHEVQRNNLLGATFYVRSAPGAPQPHSAVKGDWWVVAQYLLAEHTEVAAVGILCAVMGAVVGGFTVYHLWLAATNVTTNETFKWSALAQWREDSLEAYRAAVAAQAKAAAELAAAKASGDAAAIAQAQARLDAANTPPFETEHSGKAGVKVVWVPKEPEPVPPNAYHTGWRANLAQVLWPPGLYARGAPAASKAAGSAASESGASSSSAASDPLDASAAAAPAAAAAAGGRKKA